MSIFHIVHCNVVVLKFTCSIKNYFVFLLFLFSNFEKLVKNFNIGHLLVIGQNSIYLKIKIKTLMEYNLRPRGLDVQSVCFHLQIDKYNVWKSTGKVFNRISKSMANLQS